MTVSSAQNKVSYAGDGSTAVFSVPFLFQANGDITAILRDANGVETTWVEGTDYTLSGAGNPSGGTLTATTVPGSGEKLTIKRVVPLKQETDYPEGGQFPAQSHEDALDRGTMADQQLQEQIDRAIKLKATSALSDIDFPEPGADEYLKWNSGGTALETADIADVGALTLPVAPTDGGTGQTGVPADGEFLVGDGTKYVLESGAMVRTSLGLGTAAVKNTGVADGDVPLMDAVGYPAADGSQLTGIVTEDAVARNNILLNAFRIAINGGLSVLNMQDGIVDEFEDETGVDTGASINETYDATNDLYASFNIYDSYTTIGNNEDMFSGNNEQTGQALNLSVDTLIGQLEVNIGKTGSPTGNVVAKIYAATGTIGSSGVPTGAVLATSDPIDIATLGTTRAWRTFTFPTPYLASAGDYCVLIEYTGGDASNRLDMGFHGTGSHAGNMFRTNTAGSGWVANSSNDLAFKLKAPATTTLIANATTAEAIPTDARIVLFEEDVDTITVNTDLKAYASRDGGATYTQITLADEGDYETGKRILAGTVDISGQPSGTSMKWKVETLNTKELKVHGVALQWF